MPDTLLVSAAASLTDAFTEIGAAFAKESSGATARFNFGASGALAQQIRQGAPVDVFAAASPKEMNDLTRAGRIEAATRFVFATNRLVLVAPARSAAPRAWDDLRSAAVRRVALSSPDSVPSGRYARETLQRRGLWSAIQPKAVFGENVRQTLAYVATGDADAGLVFATDARIEARRVRVVVAAVPGRDHSPIAYPAAVVAGSRNAAAARRFVVFLRQPPARAVLKRYGFGA